MTIESIRLVNIKSFEDETLEFAHGINIIAGRNGAGKSTIVEAVGIAVFDCWPAKFKDGNARVGFIRRGQGEGNIAIVLSEQGKRFTIECNLGERRRKDKDPTTDYERILFDGEGRQISASAGRKSEFQEDIRQHILGASRIGDDKLFENIIGTAQGAFDEPFTAVESERRGLFEKILGVEDFQRYEKQFARFVRFLGERVSMLRGKAEVLQSSPGELDAAREELALRLAQSEEMQRALTAATEERTKAQGAFESEAKNKETLEKLRERVEALKQHLASVQESLTHHRKELEAAQKAEKTRIENLKGYEQYTQAESALIALRLKHEEREQEQKKYDERLRKHESLLASTDATQAGLKERLAQHEKERVDLTTEKQQLDARREELLEAWSAAKAAREKLRDEAQFIERVDSYVSELIGVQKALMDSNGAIRNLRDELATLERDAGTLLERRPQVFSQATMQAVRAETAELFASVITELDQKIEPRDIGKLVADVKAVLAAAREAVRSAEENQAEIKSKGEVVAQEIKSIERSEKKLHGEQQYVVNAMMDTNKKAAAERTEWKERSDAYTKAMQSFEKLDEKITECEKHKKDHKASFDRYIEVVSDAAKLEERSQALDESAAQELALRTDLEAHQKNLAAREAAYSDERYEKLKVAFEEAQIRERHASTEATSAATRAEEQTQRVADAEKRHAQYAALLAQALRAEAEHGFFDTVMKRVVRGLAQRVGARIVSSVSDYADELYARIAPEQSAKLVWDPMTYGIELHAPQGIVKGKELSGGQLMGVSLAIKLALIKWYSQSRIGFLDEPTTHLDKETRRHLSDVIMTLETIASDGAWFDQLFVISHEEALHGAGRRIELVRTGGISTIAAVD